jgi:hypothetical protein
MAKWSPRPQGWQLGHCWRNPIRELRSQIKLLQDASPSLHREVDALLASRFHKVRERALDQTGFAEAPLPRTRTDTGAKIPALDYWRETW